MIEVNLFSIPTGDFDVTVGKCVSRARFDKDAMNVSVLQFVKGFLKDSVDNLGNSELTELINSDVAMTSMDFASINYLLTQMGYKVTIWNVADDEENAKGIGAGTLEYNIINHNFLQSDYPTVTKLVPSEDQNVAEVAGMIVEQSGLFDESKFKGIRNPFNILVNNLKDEDGKVGIINSSIITKIYTLLDQMGINIFCATSEE